MFPKQQNVVAYGLTNTGLGVSLRRAGLGACRDMGALALTIFYSHRLKSVIQHMVSDLGLTLSIDDHAAQVSIRENRNMIEETAQRMNVGVQFHESDDSMIAVFYRGGM